MCVERSSVSKEKPAGDMDQYLNMMERCLLTTVNMGGSNGKWSAILSNTPFSADCGRPGQLSGVNV